MSRKATHSNEAGFALVLFAMLITVMVTMLALVLDLSKETVAIHHLQRSADAAALAGSAYLDGTLDGWRKAKAAAVAALKQNPIHGIETDRLVTLRLSSGPQSYWDRSSEVSSSVATPVFNSGTTGVVDNLSVVIERGVYWMDPDDPNRYRFVSFEDEASSKSNSLAMYLMANAMRVSVTMDHLNTAFAPALGVHSFRNLSRKSIAVMDHEIKMNFAPVAIPACELLFNTDPNGANVTMDTANIGKQCGRTLVVSYAGRSGHEKTNLDNIAMTTAEELKQWEKLSTLELFSSYNRPEDYVTMGGADRCSNGTGGATFAHNCLSQLNLFGTWAVAKPSQDGNQHITLTDAVNMLIGGGSEAKIGSMVWPVVEYDDAERGAAEAALAAWLDSSTQTFLNSFPRTARNRPYLRTNRDGSDGRPVVYNSSGGVANEYDLDIDYTDPRGVDTTVTMRMEPQDIHGPLGVYNFTNPRCHFPTNRVNDEGQGVRKIRAMLVVPSDEDDPDGGRRSIAELCGYDQLVNGQDSEAASIAPFVKARVVGGVDVVLYDGHLSLLEPAYPPPAPVPPQTETVPTVTIPAGADNNPAFLRLNDTVTTQWARNMKRYTDDKEGFMQCLDNIDYRHGSNSAAEQDCLDHDPSPVPDDESLADYERCFNFQPIWEAYDDLREATQTASGCIPDSECDDSVRDNSRSCPCGSQIQINDRDRARRGIQALRIFLDSDIAALPNTHCLPVRRSADEMYSLKPIPGKGACDGAVARLASCESEPISIVSGKKRDQNRPALVEVTD